MRRVVVFYERLLSGGGAERVAIMEARFLAKECYARLLTFEIDENTLSYLQNDPSELVVKLDAPRGIAPNSLVNRFRTGVHRVLSLRRQLRETSANIVVGSVWGGWLELYLATRFTGIPYILHMHGTTFWFSNDLPAVIKYSVLHKPSFDSIRNSVKGHLEFIPRKNPTGVSRVELELLAFLDYLAVRSAKAVMVLSHHMKWEVLKLYSLNAIVVPITAISPRTTNGLRDIRADLGIGNSKIILSVSRLDKRKRIDLLIRAFERLSRESEGLILVIGGKGPDQERLARLVGELGLKDKIRFTGFIADEELADYYGACDVFAYPGWADFAITIYEALAMNRRVVCSSELELDQFAKSTGLILQADPTIDKFANGLRQALAKEVEIRVDPNGPNWNNYLETVRLICERFSTQ